LSVSTFVEQTTWEGKGRLHEISYLGRVKYFLHEKDMSLEIESAY